MTGYIDSNLTRYYCPNLLKLLTVLTFMFTFGCSYHQTHPLATIHVNLIDVDSGRVAIVLNNYSEISELTFVDNTREYPSGAKHILYELIDKDGERVLKVNGLPDGRRFVVAVYDNKNWEYFYDSIFRFLQMHIPDANIERNLVSNN